MSEYHASSVNITHGCDPFQQWGYFSTFPQVLRNQMSNTGENNLNEIKGIESQTLERFNEISGF
jgi:hypothetical protein